MSKIMLNICHILLTFEPCNTNVNSLSERTRMHIWYVSCESVSDISVSICIEKSIFLITLLHSVYSEAFLKKIPIMKCILGYIKFNQPKQQEPLLKSTHIWRMLTSSPIYIYIYTYTEAHAKH